MYRCKGEAIRNHGKTQTLTAEPTGDWRLGDFWTLRWIAETFDVGSCVGQVLLTVCRPLFLFSPTVRQLLLVVQVEACSH